MQTRSQTYNKRRQLHSTNFVVFSEQKKSSVSSILCSDFHSKLRNHKKIYDVDIDFDEASKAWLQNKKKTGDGCYIYTS